MPSQQEELSETSTTLSSEKHRPVRLLDSKPEENTSKADSSDGEAYENDGQEDNDADAPRVARWLDEDELSELEDVSEAEEFEGTMERNRSPHRRVKSCRHFASKEDWNPITEPYRNYTKTVPITPSSW